jgi:putative tryptophan/tyrosine transport system substrate-binding protein
MIAKRPLFGAAAFVALGAPFACLAQTPAKVRRIGMLTNASAQPRVPAPIQALREALRELGWVEGRTLEIEYRWAEGKAERLPELAADLVRAGVELIVATGDAPIRAAKAATSTVAIVMASSDDAVGAGFVASLARPGANVTGMTSMNPDLGAKRVQLLRELQPKAERIAVLWNPGNAANGLDLKASQAAALQFGVTLLPFEVRAVDEVDSAFERIVRSSSHAMLVFNDTTTNGARPRIVQLAAQHRIAAMYEAREWAAAGGLMAYGVTHVDLFRQSAFHVDKILKGAKPADLPVEQPTLVRLTLNQAAAKALGITFPYALVLRADEVIE